METEDNMAELQKKMEKDKLFATLAMLSGDRVLAPIGKLMLEQAHEKGGRAGRARKSSIGAGFILDTETGEVVRDPDYAEYEKTRDEIAAERREELQADMLARLGYSADLRARMPQITTKETEGGFVPVQVNPNAPGGARAGDLIPVTPPISESSAQLAAASERTAANLRELRAELAANPGAVSTPKEILKNIAGALPVVGGTLRESTESASFTPAQQEVRARAQSILNEYVKDLSGAAVSAQEIERIKAAFPFAPGVSFEAAMARFPAFIDAVESKARAVRGARQPRGASGDFDTPPAPPPQKRIKVDTEGNVIGD